ASGSPRNGLPSTLVRLRPSAKGLSFVTRNWGHDSRRRSIRAGPQLRSAANRPQLRTVLAFLFFLLAVFPDLLFGLEQAVGVAGLLGAVFVGGQGRAHC